MWSAPARNNNSNSLSVSKIASGSQRVTVISARVDAVVTESEYAPSTGVVAYDSIDSPQLDDEPTLPVATPKPSTTLASSSRGSYTYSSRGTPFGGANAYAQTQDLSERHPIIDTYA